MTERKDALPWLSQEEVARRVAAQEAAEAQAKRESRERHERLSAERDYLAEGGDAKAFEREWPAIKAESLRRRTADREEQRRRASNRSYELGF